MFRLTRSRRLSRRSRAVSAVIGIAAVLWMVWMFVFQVEIGPPPTPVVAIPTERLSFATLAQEEEIVVVTFGYRREPVELRFRRDGTETKLIVSAVVWSETDRAWKMARVLTVRPLTVPEATGLDAVVAQLRRSGGPPELHAAVYEVDYRRAESSIGREKFFANRFVALRNEVHFFPREDPETKRELDEEIARTGVTPEAFAKWVTFEMLTPRDDAEEAR